MTVRFLIAENKIAARKTLKQMLRRETDFELTGEAASGAETVALIEKQKPDLIFLQIQMPDFDGFEALRKIKVEPLPIVIFTADTKHFAAEAFEVGAIDYLAVPFDQNRLQTALQKAREQMKIRQNNFLEKHLQSILEKLAGEKDFSEKILLKTPNGVTFINTNEIEWVEAAGNYVKLHVREAGHLLRETMNHIESKLNPDKFLRIHRSSLVNIDCIKELQPLFNGDYIVILKDDTKLNLSRNYHDRLQRLFDKFS